MEGVFVFCFLAEELHNSTKSETLNQVVARRIEMKEKIKTPTYLAVMGLQRKRWRWYSFRYKMDKLLLNRIV